MTRFHHLFRRFSLIVFVIFFCLVQSACASSKACSDPAGCVVIPPGDPVYIGIEEISAGEELASSREANRGAALAVENLRMADHPVHIFTVQSICLDAQVQTAAAALSSQSGIIAVLGPACPNFADTTRKIISDAGVFLFDTTQFEPLQSSSEFNNLYLARYGEFPSLEISFQSYQAVLEIIDSAQDIMEIDGETLSIPRTKFLDSLQRTKTQKPLPMTPEP